METIFPPVKREGSLDLRDTQNRRENVPPEREAEIEPVFDLGVVTACFDASVLVTITKTDVTTRLDWPRENRARTRARVRTPPRAPEGFRTSAARSGTSATIVSSKISTPSITFSLVEKHFYPT